MRHPHLRTITKAPQLAQSNTQIKLAGTTAWFQMLVDIKYTMQFKDVWGPGTFSGGLGGGGGGFGGGGGGGGFGGGGTFP